MAALRPGEDPRDGTQCLDLAGLLVGEASRRAAADLHELDDVDGRRPPEVIHELRVVVDERAIRRAAVLADRVHDAGPGGLARVDGVGQGGGQGHGTHGLLERAQRDAAQTVLRIDGLALFGHTEAAADRAGRRAQDRARDLAAAAADGAAPAVKEREIDS